MRLGGPIFLPREATPTQWVAEHLRLGYSACYLPSEDEARALELANAALRAGLVVAEVGAWSNSIAADPAERKNARDKCLKALSLADRVGAACCVNIAGSLGQQWDGPHPRNLDDDTFDLIVAIVRDLLDTVRPTRTFYTLEPMPWVFPDSPESYLRLLQAVDRKHFAVHLDVVNMVNCPARAYRLNAFLDECYSLLGPYIKAVHLKDVALTGQLTVRIEERRPGLGQLDFAHQLRLSSRLHPDLPLLLEHLPNAPEYDAAAAHIRSAAESAGLSFTQP
jgi:sugar phosphate isomerase/epimerase